jgi:hypothetical protein
MIARDVVRLGQVVRNPGEAGIARAAQGRQRAALPAWMSAAGARCFSRSAMIACNSLQRGAPALGSRSRMRARLRSACARMSSRATGQRRQS